MAYSVWNCSCQKNTRWHLPRCDSSPRSITRISVRSQPSPILALPTHGGTRQAWSYLFRHPERYGIPASSSVMSLMVYVSDRQVVTGSANPDSSLVDTSSVECTQPRRSARDRCRQTLQGGREGCAACQQRVDRDVRFGLSGLTRRGWQCVEKEWLAVLR